MAVGERIIEAQPAVKPLDSSISEQPWTEISLMPEGIRDGNPIPTLNISLMGQGAFGAETYQKLKDQGHNIGVVFAPAGERDALRKAVLADREAGIEVDIYELSKEELEKPDAAERFKKNDADLGVFASMTIKVSEEIFGGPKMGTIGYHNSELPEGRGGSAAENAISKGKKRTGISIYQVTSEADAGDYYLQAPLAIWDTDTPFSLNKDTYQLGVSMLCDTVEIFARGKQEEVRHVQDPLLPEEDFIGKPSVDWSMNAEAVYNLLRGTLNKPSYSELHPGEEIDIAEYLRTPHDVINFTGDIAWFPDRKYNGIEPGTIVEITDKGIVVTTGDGGAVRIGQLQKSRVYIGKESGSVRETTKPENKGKKIPGLQYSQEYNLVVGQAFVVPQEIAA